MTTARVTFRSVVVLAALVLVPGLAYVFGVVLPYADRGTGADGAGWVSLLGSAAVLLLPLGALVALAGCAVQLLGAFPRSSRRVSPGVAAGLAVVALVCFGVLTFLLSPAGRALISWQQD
jgi:hypothetical protein